VFRLNQLSLPRETFLWLRESMSRSRYEILAAYRVAVLGIHSALGHETPTLAHLFTRGPFPIDIGPLQHDDIDIGEDIPVRCLKNALWLSHDQTTSFVVLLSPSIEYGRVGGVHVEVAVPSGEVGL
jgi:hypothetical protein